jgi:membrane-associated protease RseP (regulator of RpoE activity)
MNEHSSDDKPLEPYRPPEEVFEDETPLIRAAQIDLIDERPRYASEQVVSRRSRLALILFGLTVLTTFWAGYKQFSAVTLVDESGNIKGYRVLNWEQCTLNGLTYSVAVLTFLGAHEMGHYLQARRYRVPASFPYFIPVPFGPLGTMGAVIVQGAGFANRKALFDIAISGPLAGLVVAIPLNWWAISQTKIATIPQGGISGYNNPLIVEWMVALIHRPMAANEDIILTPLLFAGWVGIFITALNLIPIGQLDGGHIFYTLLLRRAQIATRWIYRTLVAVVVLGALFVSQTFTAWTLMLILLGLMGSVHPPTADDQVPLGLPRIILGWLTLAFIIIGFVPIPFY